MTVSIPDAYEKVKPFVGKSERIDLGALGRIEFQRFAVAVGDMNPLYFDDAFAKEAGYPGVIAPALYPSAVMTFGAGRPDEQMRADGTAGDEVISLPIEGLRLMGGGQDLEFHHPVTDGARITMEVGVESVELKEGRSGAFLILKLARRYFDGEERLLAACREAFIVR